MPRLILIAALLVLAMPSRANATSLGAVRGALLQAEAVAEAYWPGDACTGRVQVQLMSRAALAAIRGHDDADAQALPDTCQIQVAWDPSLSRTLLCAVLVHERGHLHGVRFPNNPEDPLHSPDPSNIMFAGVGDAPRQCMDAFRPYFVRLLRRQGRSCYAIDSWYSWRCDHVRDDIPAI